MRDQRRIGQATGAGPLSGGVMSRRGFLLGSAGIGAVGLLGVGRIPRLSISTQAQTTLPVLKTYGRELIDASGSVMPRMKGFNVQPSGWAASQYQAMAAEGAKIIRTVIFWDTLEPAQGSISTSYIATLDAHVQNCVANGLYTVFNFYFGPNGVHSPSWTGGSSAMSTYLTYGQYATQYLAQRYGNPSDPLRAGQYTAAVIGFELNEITPDYTDQADWVVNLYSQQATMISWFRAYASDWIGVISSGFGASAPYANAPGSGQTSQWFTTPGKNPFSAAGGNFMLDMHDYLRCLSTGQAQFDGREANGTTGSTVVQIDNTAYPAYPPVVNGASLPRSTCQSEFAAYLAPYVAYCGPWYANVPLMIGESGFVPLDGSTTFTSPELMAADKADAWADANAVVECQWDFNTNQSSDKWAAYPGPSAVGADANGWQSWTNTWMGAYDKYMGKRKHGVLV